MSKRRMYHLRLTFLLRSRGVSVTYLYSYGISLSYVRRIKAYVLVRVTYGVWRMKYTCDVSTAYVLHSILICGVSVLYLLLLMSMRINGCVNFVHAIRTLQLSIIRGQRKQSEVGEEHLQAPHPVVRHGLERTLNVTPNLEKHLIYDFGKTKTFI